MRRILLFYRLRRKYKKYVKFNNSVLIGKNSIFEGMNYIDSNSSFDGEMGFGSYIAKNTHLKAKIGRFCSIGSFVMLNNGIHPSSVFVSTSPVFYSLSKKIKGGTFVDKQYFEELRYVDNEKKYPIIIGNDCWIGDGVFFVGGVTIGDGAVILAHSVVSKDIPPYSIVGGVPAKVLKYRFDENTIQFLLDFKWWNKDELWLRNNLSLMQDVELLKDNSFFL